MGKIYGYCRISRATQNIERQNRNIKDLYEDAIIINEVFTGTKIEGRKQWNKLLNVVKKGDTIVFDSVSRMSRNANEGFELYEELFKKGVELVFIKESYINTSTYKSQMDLSESIAINGTGVVIKETETFIKNIIMGLAKEQIKIAFEQAEKEVKDLQQRTREGIETARLNGKQIGHTEGTKLVTKKSIEVKKQIQKYSKDFQGTLKDVEVMKLVGVARNSYYKYKKELVVELSE